MPKLTFKNIKDKEKKTTEVPKGINLRAAMINHGVDVHPGLATRLNCGGRGHCGTCRVHIPKGFDNCSPMELKEKLRISFSWFGIGNEEVVRLSCQTNVMGDMTIIHCPDDNLYGQTERVRVTRSGNVDEV